MYAACAWLVPRSRQWITAWSTNERPLLTSFLRGFQWGTVSALLLLSFVLSRSGETVPFIYFQF
jgi:hypothetical protein